MAENAGTKRFNATYFIFVCSFFLAWMTLDQRRIEARHNACCPCFSHSDWRPNRLSQKSLLKTIFSAYSKILARTPVKVDSIFLIIAFFSVH